MTPARNESPAPALSITLTRYGLKRLMGIPFLLYRISSSAAISTTSPCARYWYSLNRSGRAISGYSRYRNSPEMMTAAAAYANGWSNGQSIDTKGTPDSSANSPTRALPLLKGGSTQTISAFATSASLGIFHFRIVFNKSI